MKGILIAYSFYPQKTVGALRPTYWAEEISNLSSIQLDVITASKCKLPNVTEIPLQSTSILSTLIKDEGLRWKKDVLRHLSSISLKEYSFAIITGGPFFHFYALAKFFKKHKLKIILDFRDPFSYNPRFNEKGLKKWIKQSYEQRAVKQADLILAVNKECHRYIAPKTQVKRAIVPNGFDERVIVKSEQHEQIQNSLFYAGRLYWNPLTFFETMSNNQWNFYHAGQNSEFEHTFFHTKNYHYLGLLTQNNLYNELKKYEIGVVFTMNIPFESTTKIYDYIGLNKKILVVTLGKPEKGALMRELSNYPYYSWVENNAAAIEKAVLELQQMQVKPFNPTAFSRKTALQKLIHEIKSLCN